MIIYYSKDEQKLIPDIEKVTKKIIKEKNKNSLLSTGEIIRVKNKEVKDPGLILFVDTDILSKYRYLVAKVEDLQAHWYSREEIEIVKDESIKQAVLEWYKYNKEILFMKNKEKMLAI